MKRQTRKDAAAITVLLGIYVGLVLSDKKPS